MTAYALASDGVTRKWQPPGNVKQVRVPIRMRIVNLIENTEGSAECACSHGLSFYVETEKHKLLVDLGPSEETLKNAEKLDIDLTQVDTVILSHGHYDHSGGIMTFSGINPNAVIYMQESANEDYYSDNGEGEGEERYRYIGIDKAIMNLPQVRAIKGDHCIDDELELFTVKNRTHKLPSPLNASCAGRMVSTFRMISDMSIIW